MREKYTRCYSVVASLLLDIRAASTHPVQFLVRTCWFTSLFFHKLSTLYSWSIVFPSSTICHSTQREAQERPPSKLDDETHRSTQVFPNRPSIQQVSIASMNSRLSGWNEFYRVDNLRLCHAVPISRIFGIEAELSRDIHEEGSLMVLIPPIPNRFSISWVASYWRHWKPIKSISH